MKAEKRLADLIKSYYAKVDHSIGYPVCQLQNVAGFGDWYARTGLCDMAINNVGNPFDGEQYLLNSTLIEREVIQTLAPFYGIPKGKEWGFVTHSGTDGNMHGIYFGAKILQKKTGMLPIVYISKEAHYSSSRICDVQNLETRMIDFDESGSMDIECLRKNIDPSRPALVVGAIGSTFMGATDDIKKIKQVLEEVKPLAYYIHLDAALFGGYLPFTKYKDLVSMKELGYDSIAVSGHKFFGIDEPSGLFLATKVVIESQTSAKVAYLHNDMPLINCSRSGLSPLKFYWLIEKYGFDMLKQQANQMLENTEYLQKKFDEIGYPAWHMKYSNTVFFKRPPEWIRKKYSLANGFLPAYGGDLSHIVVMQHVSKNIIDEFINDLLLGEKKAKILRLK